MITVNDQVFLTEVGYIIRSGYGGYSVYLGDVLIFSGSAYNTPELYQSQVHREERRYEQLAWTQAKVHFELTRERQARTLWQKFGEVPCDDDGLIQEKFLGFELGADREEVIQWIEAKFEVAIYDLMFPEEKRND